MWIEENNRLYKKFVFTNFNEAFSFMKKVAILIDRVNHHPTWTNTWNTVEIWLTTHEQGNKVTEKDSSLAMQIDALQ